MRVAIVGRPNVGKSSLANALLGDKRTIVSPIPGTTRDAIDTDLLFEGTAGDPGGYRRPEAPGQAHDHRRRVLQLACGRSRALERCRRRLGRRRRLEGLVDLDLQVAYEAQRNKCATAILFNKWDISTLELDKATERVKAKVQMKPPG